VDTPTILCLGLAWKVTQMRSFNLGVLSLPGLSPAPWSIFS
jgi:hypothetical protein